MSKPSTIEASSTFGIWVEQVIERYGLNRKAFAVKAGVGTSTVTNWIAGLRSPKKVTIVKVASALESDARLRSKLVDEGLRAAGFASAGAEIEYEPILDELRSASYDGGFGTDDVDEIAEYIRMKARRRAERQGRA